MNPHVGSTELMAESKDLICLGAASRNAYVNLGDRGYGLTSRANVRFAEREPTSGSGRNQIVCDRPRFGHSASTKSVTHVSQKQKSVSPL